jgi:hypothetical protein
MFEEVADDFGPEGAGAASDETGSIGKRHDLELQ